MPGPNDLEAERVFLGLGGNVGDPARTMAAALAALERHPEIEVVAVSSLYRTPPWGRVDQPDFLNAVAELKTALEPRALLDTCLAVERASGRERNERWGPRTIDLDIIAFGNRVIREEGLEIPHPRLASRAFVLVPFAEIAGSFEIGGTSVTAMANAVDAAGIERIAGPSEWRKQA